MQLCVRIVRRLAWLQLFFCGAVFIYLLLATPETQSIGQRDLPPLLAKIQASSDVNELRAIAQGRAMTGANTSLTAMVLCIMALAALGLSLAVSSVTIWQTNKLERLEENPTRPHSTAS